MMRLTKITNKLITFLYYLLKFRSIRVGFTFAHYGLPLKTAKLIKSEGTYLVSNETGNRIRKKSVTVFSNELQKLIICVSDNRIQVEQTFDDHFDVLVNGIRLHVNSASNLVTLFELFIETIYDVDLKEDVIVMDIGMNVCYAALWFSNLPFVKKVYSYEPFLSTFSEGRKNMQMNPLLASKITPHNLGISTRNTELEVPAMESGAGDASINEEILKIHNTPQLSTVKVKVVDIEQEIERIINIDSFARVLMKVDCEGEEYSIFEKLASSPYIDRIAGFIIEWHVKGPDPILAFLKENNFRCLSLPKYDKWSGMIYAFPAA